MSTEAIALSRLIVDLQKITCDPRTAQKIIDCIDKATLYIDPWQGNIDRAYHYLNANVTWGREEGLGYVESDLGEDCLIAVCLGHMNYTVEQVGFAGWLRHSTLTTYDWAAIETLASKLRTPVGVQFQAIMLGVRTIWGNFYGLVHTDEEVCGQLKTDLELFTNAYTSIKTAFLIELQAYMRRDK